MCCPCQCSTNDAPRLGGDREAPEPVRVSSPISSEGDWDRCDSGPPPAENVDAEEAALSDRVHSIFSAVLNDLLRVSYRGSFTAFLAGPADWQTAFACRAWAYVQSFYENEKGQGEYVYDLDVLDDLYELAALTIAAIHLYNERTAR